MRLARLARFVQSRRGRSTPARRNGENSPNGRQIAQTQRNERPCGDASPDPAGDAVESWSRTFAGSGPLRLARRIGIGVAGSAVLGVGIVMLVTPGPAFVVIPLGLGILALEFEWAQRWLERVKAYARDAMHKGDRGDRPAS